MLRCVRVAVRVVVLPAGMRPSHGQHRQLRVEPPDEDLVRGHALLSDDLEKANRVPVAATVHLADYGQEVPHALRFSATQRSQQGTPFGGGGRSAVGQVVDVTVDHRRGQTELDEYLLDVLVQRLLVQVPVRLVVGGGACRWIRSTANCVNRRGLCTQQLIQ